MIAAEYNPTWKPEPRTRQTDLNILEFGGVLVKNMSRRTAIIGTTLAASAVTLGQGSSARAVTQPSPATQKSKPKKIGIIVFPRFETLDVFGPVQMWGRLPDHDVTVISEHGGEVRSAQGVATVADYSFATAPQLEILMIPGGEGTRIEVNNPTMLDFLRKQNLGTEWTISVCTGAALLAKAGILDGRKATTNKRAYKWATSQSTNVQWQSRARWVMDGKFLTSSGVSAGTDMALGLVAKLYGRSQADQIARDAEYIWNDDPQDDPFSV